MPTTSCSLRRERWGSRCASRQAITAQPMRIRRIGTARSTSIIRLATISCWVAGTQIDGGQDVVWNDGTPFDVNTPGGGGWASGGGISEVFGVPSYQANSNLPVSIDNEQQGRGVPDIAMSATNYFTRVDNSEGASGGTSAVAPLMAALVARLNQAKKQNVGFLNPFLYANAAKGLVHDVTSGTNAIKNTIKGYNAGLGWDACTGLGTPDGTAILNNLP